MDDVANESSKNANEKLFRLQDPRVRIIAPYS